MSQWEKFKLIKERKRLFLNTKNIYERKGKVIFKHKEKVILNKRKV